MSALLTLEEVCERVRLSPWAVRRAIRRGELRAYKLRGRLRIPADSVEDWLQASVVESEIVGTEPEQQLSTVTPKVSATFRERLRKGSEDERAYGSPV
jgi:excisionase family DNA binding protein